MADCNSCSKAMQSRSETAMSNLNIYTFDGTLIGTRNFNKERDYWWPVPSAEMELAPSLRPNNPGW